MRFLIGLVILSGYVVGADDDAEKLNQPRAIYQKMSIVQIDERQTEKVTLDPKEWGISEKELRIEYLQDPQEKIALNK